MNNKFKNKIIILLLFSITLLFSCSGNQQSVLSNSTQLDSLSDRCSYLSGKLQADSLRIASEAYMMVAEPYSKQFYEARRYYITSYFYSRDYDKVISMLTSTKEMPLFNEYPDMVCGYMYTHARALQYSKRYPEAIEAFKLCLNFIPEKEDQYESLLPTILAAMTQLMNTYCASGGIQNGYLYYSEMKSNPSPVIRRFAMRDLYSHLGYLAIQAGYSSEPIALQTQSLFYHYIILLLRNFSVIILMQQLYSMVMPMPNSVLSDG